jgi:hypothetical protein
MLFRSGKSRVHFLLAQGENGFWEIGNKKVLGWLRLYFSFSF